MNRSWQVFVGDWPDRDWVHQEKVFAEWSSAQAWMLNELQKLRDDECEVCRGDAYDAEGDLNSADEGEWWTTNIDGNDYCIYQ
jgi:hypothetical protein